MGYFIIFQLGNGGEVTKYLQQVNSDVLASVQVQFALRVWASLKTENSAKFFKLLRSADLLQACLMHRYVGPMRLTAIKKMARGFFKGLGAETYYPLKDLMKNLLFEDEEDALEFLDHCGFEVRTPLLYLTDPSSFTTLLLRITLILRPLLPFSLDIFCQVATPDDILEGSCVILTNHNISDSLPTDKNGNTIAPTVNPLTIGIESKRTSNNW